MANTYASARANLTHNLAVSQLCCSQIALLYYEYNRTTENVFDFTRYSLVNLPRVTNPTHAIALAQDPYPG